MSVSLNPPNTLGFNRPLTKLVRRLLTITNNNALPVAFKVKTTAPKLYCVRPNSGRVEPGESVDVTVMLQALKEEPPMNTKCKDKFLIQSTIITPEKETLPLHDIWSSPEANEEGKVHQQKLRVSYLPPEGQQIEEEDEYANRANMTSVLSMNDSHIDNPHQFPTNDTHTDRMQDKVLAQPIHDSFRPSTPPLDFSVAREDSHDSPPKDTDDVVPRPPSPPPAPDHAYEPGHAAVPEPVLVTKRLVPPAPETIIVTKENPVNEELQARLKEALGQIEELKIALAAQTAIAAQSVAPSEGLRRRTRAPSDVDSFADTDVQTMVEDGSLNQEGVPLQVVVIISLGVFITTYLFF